jgi:hypothetical protein
MLPYYKHDKYADIYFVTFLIINTILIVNMVIGVFYQSFKDEIEKETHKIMNKSNDQLIE